jgi:hypothetical protein
MGTPHPKSVRLSPYYVQLLSDLVYRTRLGGKSQIVNAAITLVYNALLRSRTGRVVLRSDEQKRQKGVDLAGSIRETHVDAAVGHSSALRLNLSQELRTQLQAVVDGGFALDESKAIRRALVVFNEVLQHLTSGWELGWIDGSGTFNPLPTAVSMPGSLLVSESADRYQKLRRMMIEDIEVRLPEIISRSEYTGQDVETVANCFLAAGYASIAQLNIFEQCFGDIEKCIDKFADLAIGVNRASNPSLVIAVKNLDDVKVYFLKPVMAHLRSRIPVYFLHHSEDRLRDLEVDLREDIAAIKAAERYCFAVPVEKDYYKNMPETVVSHYESSILRCGIKWFSSGGRERRFDPLSADNLDQFFDQVEPRIRNNAIGFDSFRTHEHFTAT